MAGPREAGGMWVSRAGRSTGRHGAWDVGTFPDPSGSLAARAALWGQSHAPSRHGRLRQAGSTRHHGHCWGLCQARGRAPGRVLGATLSLRPRPWEATLVPCPQEGCSVARTSSGPPWAAFSSVHWAVPRGQPGTRRQWRWLVAAALLYTVTWTSQPLAHRPEPGLPLHQGPAVLPPPWAQALSACLWAPCPVLGPRSGPGLASPPCEGLGGWGWQGS